MTIWCNFDKSATTHKKEAMALHHEGVQFATSAHIRAVALVPAMVAKCGDDQLRECDACKSVCPDAALLYGAYMEVRTLAV
jgi:ferredoxin